MIGRGGQDRFRRMRKEDDTDSWVVTFADMATLLLAFFVLLVSISHIDASLFEQVKAGMAKGIGKREITTPIENLRQDLEDTIQALQVDDTVGLAKDTQGVTLEFAAASFYEPGKAEIRAEAIPILNRVAATIGADRYRGFQVEVQGHTDDTPISTAVFPSNWELSAGRATRIVRFFEAAGIEPSRMTAIGYADTAPKVPNRDPFGEALPQNQEINRRVVVRIFPR